MASKRSVSWYLLHIDVVILSSEPSSYRATHMDQCRTLSHPSNLSLYKNGKQINTMKLTSNPPLGQHHHRPWPCGRGPTIKVLRGSTWNIAGRGRGDSARVTAPILLSYTLRLLCTKYRRRQSDSANDVPITLRCCRGPTT